MGRFQKRQQDILNCAGRRARMQAEHQIGTLFFSFSFYSYVLLLAATMHYYYYFMPYSRVCIYFILLLLSIAIII